MLLAQLMKLIHILAAFWIIIGIVGRNITMQKAAHSAEIGSLRTLLSLAQVFENRMVLPGSFAVLTAGLATAWVQGWPILGFLQGGSSNWVLVSLILFLTIIPVIRFIFLPRGKIFEAAFDQAQAQNRVTPELTTAFNDPLVRAGHIYEMALLGLVTVLMVLKPF
jgi:hypothetical protein